MKKAVSIIVILALVVVLAFLGYEGYQAYQDWKAGRTKQIKSDELRLIELLNDNQEAIVKLYTKIAAVEKKVIGDTLKETVVVKEEAPTYESKKEELIELRKDPEVNEEKIKVARVEFEERINEFQESPDKILINTGEEKIVIYEDAEGNLVSLESGVTITRHRDAEEVIKELKAGTTIEKEEDKKYNLSLNAIYDLDAKSFYPGLSYQLWDWRKFNLNVTGYDFENIKGGLDLCYTIGDNLVVGAGMNLFEWEDFEFNLDKYYLKAGIEFSF